MPLSSDYAIRTAAGDITRDPAQEAALKHLDAFITRFKQTSKSLPPRSPRAPRRKNLGVLGVLGGLNFLKRRKNSPIKGVYLYGGVGRGKTMLMDLLVAHLHSDRVRRVHFHAFMLEVHARLKVIRDNAQTDDFLGTVANDIAAETDLLCFDELHVNDIADAMILGPLFSALMNRGVAIVATSNYKPDDLYKNGLQRARFLPFIDIIKKNMDVAFLDSATDYRLRALTDAGTWFHPLGEPSQKAFATLFETLTGHVPLSGTAIEIGGRTLPITKADARCAWLNFETLCREARGAADYLALGHSFEIIFVDAIPTMGEDQRNEARRFMTLVDTLYDLKRVLVARANSTPHELYKGDTHAFEWQRTVSRLLEMQSPDWFNHNAVK